MSKHIPLCNSLVGLTLQRIVLTAAVTIGITAYLPAQVNLISSQTIPGANACTGLFAAHFNSDAKSDFLAACLPSWPAGSPPENIVLLNNGNGTYTQVNDKSSGFLVPRLVTDLNGDGISDLVLAGDGGTGIYVQLGNPDGTFRAPTFVPGIGSNGNFIVVAGDFSGNGRKDLASIDFPTSSGSLTIALNKGDGTFQIGNSYTLNVTAASQYMTYLSSGDINGDGKADLVVEVRDLLRRNRSKT